jgi:hypothetical protein
MKRIALAAATLLCSISVSAQNVRSFVASTGVDGNPCTLASPCRTIPYAFTTTNAGGDIVVLDSAGYGTSLTINRSVNIIVPPGVFATMTPTGTGTTAINVAAGSGDVIRIDGLRLLGSGTSSNQLGVSIGTCKRTELYNMMIKEIAFPVKIVADTRAYLKNLDISEFVYGIWSAGVNTDPATSTLKVTVVQTGLVSGTIGVKVDNGSLMMLGSQSGLQGNRVAYCSDHAVVISANVSACSQVVPEYGFFEANVSDARANNTYGPCQAP